MARAMCRLLLIAWLRVVERVRGKIQATRGSLHFSVISHLVITVNYLREADLLVSSSLPNRMVSSDLISFTHVACRARRTVLDATLSESERMLLQVVINKARVINARIRPIYY